MVTVESTPTPTRPRRLTTGNKVGLVLAALLAVGDVTGPFTPMPADGDQAGPPMAVLIAGAVLGVITLVGVVWTWRTGSRPAARVVAGTRILSALSALPAFFVGGVPGVVVLIAATGILLTALTCFLVLRPARSAA
jgi:hypothetical protein